MLLWARMGRERQSLGHILPCPHPYPYPNPTLPKPLPYPPLPPGARALAAGSYTKAWVQKLKWPPPLCFHRR